MRLTQSRGAKADGKFPPTSPSVSRRQTTGGRTTPRKHLQRQRFKEVFASQRETSIGVTPHNNSRGNSPKAQLDEEEVSLTDQQGLLTKTVLNPRALVGLGTLPSVMGDPQLCQR